MINRRTLGSLQQMLSSRYKPDPHREWLASWLLPVALTVVLMSAIACHVPDVPGAHRRPSPTPTIASATVSPTALPLLTRINKIDFLLTPLATPIRTPTPTPTVVASPSPVSYNTSRLDNPTPIAVPVQENAAARTGAARELTELINSSSTAMKNILSFHFDLHASVVVLDQSGTTLVESNISQLGSYLAPTDMIVTTIVNNAEYSTTSYQMIRAGIAYERDQPGVEWISTSAEETFWNTSVAAPLSALSDYSVGELELQGLEYLNGRDAAYVLAGLADWSEDIQLMMPFDDVPPAEIRFWIGATDHLIHRVEMLGETVFAGDSGPALRFLISTSYTVSDFGTAVDLPLD